MDLQKSGLSLGLLLKEINRERERERELGSFSVRGRM
jgi:hypothetical protein